MSKKQFSNAGATELHRGKRVELSITGLSSEGDGVGRYKGFTVFVPGALSGEEIVAEIGRVKKTFAEAELKEVKKAAADRVKPACPVYDQCGGCQLQHLSYEGELKEKQSRVKDALVRLGHLDDVPVLPVMASENPLYYRNKMQFPVVADGRDTHIGCFAMGTHKVIDVDDCLIQKEKNNKIVAVVRRWMKEYKIPAYDEDRRKGLIRHVMGRVGVRTGEVMVCLVTAKDMVPHAKELAKMLKADVPGFKSLVQNVNYRATNVILGTKTKVLHGKPSIKDKISNLKFNISAESFFQVNSEQAQKLYSKALEFADLKGEETVVDLYCGTGTITLFLAQKAKVAIGIEIVPSAIRDAKKNAVANHAENAEFICGDAAIEMPKLVEKGLRPDVVILDPPRAGCEERVLEAIAKVKPKKVVYVSCNPATLARDLAFLAKHGFNVQKVQPCDMFSRTFHVENVALCTRK